MSGGRFDYTQYHITTIADSIESELDRQGKEKPKDELYFDKEYLEKYPEERFYYTHPEEVQHLINLHNKLCKFGAKSIK